jgi:hypothetical protein
MNEILHSVTRLRTLSALVLARSSLSLVSLSPLRAVSSLRSISVLVSWLVIVSVCHVHMYVLVLVGVFVHGVLLTLRLMNL